MNTVKNDLETVEAATTSTELFGSATTDSESRRRAKRQFHCLVAAIHPDRAQARDIARYAAATTRLNELYRSWVAEAEAVQSSATYVGDNNEYVLGDVLARGSVATLYRAQDRSGASVVVKIPRSRRANPLMETERSALTDIRGAPYVPTLVDRISAADPASGKFAGSMCSMICPPALSPSPMFAALTRTASIHETGPGCTDACCAHLRQPTRRIGSIQRSSRKMC